MWQFLLSHQHVIINTIVTKRTQLILVLFCILFIITFLVEDMLTIITDHSLVYAYVCFAYTASQVANMTMVLYRIFITIDIIIWLHIFSLSFSSKSLLSFYKVKVN